MIHEELQDTMFVILCFVIDLQDYDRILMANACNYFKITKESSTKCLSAAT